MSALTLNRTLGFLRRNFKRHLIPPTPPPGVVLQEELESAQPDSWQVITVMKLGVWLAFLGSWNGNPSGKRGKTIDLYCYIKVLKVKPVYQQMTLSPKLGVLEISTRWHFRLPLLIQMFIKVVSSPRLSGFGMPSPILVCWDAEDCVAKFTSLVRARD